MGEPQAVHCGPWFCASSMGFFSEISAQPGVPGSPESQSAALGLKESDAMTLISTRLHLGHSNNRCSKPIGPGKTRSSIILVWQCEQRRRSVAVKDCGDEGTMRPLIGGRALPISLSPIPSCSDGDGANLAQHPRARLVNIDHYCKFRAARTIPVRGRAEAVISSDSQGHGVRSSLPTDPGNPHSGRIDRFPALRQHEVNEAAGRRGLISLISASHPWPALLPATAEERRAG